MLGDGQDQGEREERLGTGGDVRLVVPAAPEYLRLVRLTGRRPGQSSRLHLRRGGGSAHRRRRAVLPPPRRRRRRPVDEARTMDLTYSAGADSITITGRTGPTGVPAEPSELSEQILDALVDEHEVSSGRRPHHLPAEEAARVVTHGVRGHRSERAAAQARGVRRIRRQSAARRDRRLPGGPGGISRPAVQEPGRADRGSHPGRAPRPPQSGRAVRSQPGPGILHLRHADHRRGAEAPLPRQGLAVRVPRRVQELHLRMGTVSTACPRSWAAPHHSRDRPAAEVSVDEVLEAMEAGRAYRFSSIDAPAGDDDDRAPSPAAAQLGEDDTGLEEVEQRILLSPLIASLPNGSR